MTLPGRHDTVAFTGAGYHDHNFGRLPFRDTEIWYWGRAALAADTDPAAPARTAVFYHLRAPEEEEGEGVSALLLLGPDGVPLVHSDRTAFLATAPIRSAYNLRHASRLVFAGEQARLTAILDPRRRAFLEGPFYRRLPLRLEGEMPGWTGAGAGIGEVFRPDGLCGPIASRAMWSRIRRRRGSGTAGRDAGGGHAP